MRSSKILEKYFGKFRTEVPKSRMRNSILGEGVFLVSSELKFSMRSSKSGGVFFAKNGVFCVILTTKS